MDFLVYKLNTGVLILPELIIFDRAPLYACHISVRSQGKTLEQEVCLTTPIKIKRYPSAAV